MKIKSLGRWAPTILALALMGTSATAATVHPSLLINGSFETGIPGKAKGLVNRANFNQLPTSGPTWDVWKTLNGWKTTAGPGIEVDSNRTSPLLDAEDGRLYAQLDSTGNSAMNQGLRLGVGRYNLTFWYSPQTAVAATNAIAYGLGNLVSGQVTVGTAGAQVGVWTLVHKTVSVTRSGYFNLSFAAAGTSDGVGGYLDNIGLAPVPVPAAGFALLGGLAGLAGVSRRRRA